MAPRVVPPPCCFSGAACATCLVTDNELRRTGRPPLQRCSRCHHMWYCGTACQAQSWRERHKSTCKHAAKLMDGVLEDLKAKPATSYDDYSRRMVEAFVRLSADLSVELNHDLMSIFRWKPCCQVCFRVREQLPPGCSLVSCPTCCWGWACSEHTAAHLAGAHRAHCATYARHTAARALGALHYMQNAGQAPVYCPQGSVARVGKLPGSWDAYRRLRKWPPFVDEFVVATSNATSLAMTAVAGLHRFYSLEQLAAMQEVTLHLVGATEGYEVVDAGSVLEEVLHFLPDAKSLHTVLVGPELKLIGKKERFMALPMGTCPSCSAGGRKRTTSCHQQLYHEFAAGEHYTTPQLVLALNSGIHEAEEGSAEDRAWGATVRVLAERQLPIIWTSYTRQEAADDAVALRRHGAQVVGAPELNPWRSEFPNVDPPAGQDVFYYYNMYATATRGG